MADLFSLVVPAGLDGWTSFILIVSAFFTSGLTAALSLGGGITLIAILTFFLPAAIAVPMHGVAQFGSNAGRAFLRRKDVQWQYAIWFALGGIPGAILGGQVAVWMPNRLFTLLIAAFLLYSVWGTQAILKKSPTHCPVWFWWFCRLHFDDHRRERANCLWPFEVY